MGARMPCRPWAVEVISSFSYVRLVVLLLETNSEVLPCGEGFSGDVEGEEDLKGCSVEKDLWAVAEAGILRGCCVAKDLLGLPC